MIPSGPRAAVADGLIVAVRNLKRVPRIPELAVFAVLQSIMFVLLFAFVFGGAIPLPDGGSYREYLMPGIFVQTLAFSSITTAIGMADDMNKGLIDRFRSLPMARSAVLSGRTVADVVYTSGILVVLMLSGLAVGWRVHGSVGDFVLAIAVLLFFTYAMAWLGVLLGLLVPSVEVAQQLGFLAIFPLTFLSNAFVPPGTLPGVLQPIAEWNPLSSLVAATRDLFGNPGAPASSSFPAEHPLLLSLLWTVALLAVFAPLAVRRYRAIDR
ncbi:MAG: ABC transporter permease [Thermoleophilia bacterium]